MEILDTKVSLISYKPRSPFMTKGIRLHHQTVEIFTMGRILFSKKTACLLTLTVFTTLSTMVMHRSRRPSGELYLPATSVFLGEALKFIISLITIKYNKWKSSDKCLITKIENVERAEYTKNANDSSSTQTTTDVEGLFHCPHKSNYKYYRSFPSYKIDWTFAIPSLLYVTQNLLQLFSSTFVSPVVYQSLSQLKILTAAMMTGWILGRRLNIRQWMALLVLLSGVFILNHARYQEIQRLSDGFIRLGFNYQSPFFQVATSKKIYKRQAVASSSLERINLIQGFLLRMPVLKASFFVGTGGVICSCFLGSAAGIYLEKQIKKSAHLSLAHINAQLGFFGMISASIAILLHCGSHHIINPLHGFGFWAWATVVVRALGGFLIALVLKQADSILKGFATSFAIVLSIAVEAVLWNHDISTKILIGSGLVCFSSLMYSKTK